MEGLLAVPIRNLLALYLGTLMFGVSIYSRGSDTQDAREPSWPTKEWQTWIVRTVECSIFLTVPALQTSTVERKR